MSDTQADHSRLAELTSKLGLHEHLCLIYNTQEEQFAAATPYLRAGLERGEKCLYVADENTAAAVLDALRRGGTDVDHYLRTGALTIVDKNEAYLNTGRFDPDLTIRFWTEAAAEAGAAKFSGLRTLVAEMTWALGGSEGADRLIEYESKLNRFVRDHDARMICQYNRTRFSPEVILGVIRTHPLVVYGGHIAKNPYYVPPDEFLKPNQPALEIDRLLKNILEWQQAQEAQRQSEERFRTLFAAVQVGVVVTGPKGEVWMCNPAALGLLGVTEDQLLGTTLYDPKWKAICEDGSPWPPEAHPILEVIATGQSVRNTLMGVYRSGLQDFVWLLVSAQPQVTADGNISQVICSFEDITERKRAEDDLRRQKEILQKIFDNVPIMINFTGADGRIELINREWERTIGWTLKEIREQNVDILAATYPDPQYRQKALEFVAAAEGKFADFKTRIRDGRVIDTSWARVRLSDGTTIGIGRDITASKQAEEALRESEQKFRQLAENIREVFWMADAAAERVLYVSPAYEQVWGRTCQTLYQNWRSFLEAVHPDDHDRMLAAYENQVHNQAPINQEYRIIRPDGSLGWIWERSFPVRDDRGRVYRFVGVAEDVTERKLAEESLRRSEAYLAEGQKLSHTGSWALNLSSGELYWSQETYRIFGFDPAKTTATLNEAFLQRIHPEDRPRIEQGLKAVALHKRHYEIDYRIVLPGGSIRYIHEAVYPVTTKAGEVIERYGLAMDVTERKRTEEDLQRSRDQLRALAARLQRIREEERTKVAREIHDELGQALTAIKIDLSSLIHELPSELNQQSRRAESILRLVDETLQSVRRISTDLRPAVLDALGLVAAVEWATEEFQARTGTKCHVSLPDADIPMEPERATALFRIFQETLTNVARHANATEVNVRLAKDNDNLSLEVRDNGKGISEEQLAAGESLGILGMRERALLLGGELNIRSAPGRGTTVSVRIPQSYPTRPGDGP